MKESKRNLSERIDKRLVDLGLVSTRTRAQAMVMAGHVLVDDVPFMKPGERVSLDSVIRLREPELKYVSRGALKLKKAIEDFHISAKDRIAIDVGSSTGGFTEILLEEGAQKVYAIDAGTNQLAWKLRTDPRVVVRENCNARYLQSADFSERMSMLVMDVSFISIRKILPAIMPLLQESSDCVVLFKPQFEVGPAHIESGGIVRDQAYAKKLLGETIDWAIGHGLFHARVIDSPVLGADGNHEYLIHWIKKSSRI